MDALQNQRSGRQTSRLAISTHLHDRFENLGHDPIRLPRRLESLTPESAADFSAVGFHFGKQLSENLNVPIGLIDTSWGGKKVEAFTSVEKLKTVADGFPLVLEWEDLAQ